MSRNTLLVHVTLSNETKTPRRQNSHNLSLTGWVRILRADVIRTTLISVLTGAKMQRLEVVRGHSEFLSHFSIPQANPTQPVTITMHDAVDTAVCIHG